MIIPTKERAEGFILGVKTLARMIPNAEVQAQAERLIAMVRADPRAADKLERLERTADAYATFKPKEKP